MRLRAFAPAKVNLCLFLGPVRGEDGRHELVTLFESISLADQLELSVASSDEVLCLGVSGPNLVERALGLLREAGWTGPPVRIEVLKRIPVAAGLGGGSADAAAALRLAHAVSPLPAGLAEAVARELGADVPSQLQPGLALGVGAGETVERLDPVAPHAFVIVPQPFGLLTADVYGEADRLGLPRRSLAGLAERLRAARPCLPEELVVNELEPAALALRPQVRDVLDAVRRAGADQALVCGSGPTVAGVFWGEEAWSRASGAADRVSDALVAEPVAPSFAEPSPASGTMDRPG